MNPFRNQGELLQKSKNSLNCIRIFLTLKPITMNKVNTLLLGLAVMILASCNDKKRETQENSIAVKEAEENFDWLTGEWQRTNEEEGRKTFEFWLKMDNGEYHGVGHTMEDEDTIWYEEMVLVDKGEVWNLEITGEGDSLPTAFELISVESQGFTSENAQNKFPKQISYSLEGDTLKAVISGGGPEIPFVFVRPEE